MTFKIEEIKSNKEVIFKISNLVTLCPHRRYDKEDITEVKITYKPGKYVISRDELESYVKNEIEGKEIAMEIIPLKILNWFIQSTVMRKPASRKASPQLVEINTTSKGKGKKFTISTNIRFEKRS